MIDRSSWNRLGIVKYQIYVRLNDAESTYGRNLVKEYRFIDKLPEYMELAQESIDAGWVYDPVAHTAYKTESGKNVSTSVDKGVEIVLKFKDNVPDSLANTEISNNATSTVVYDNNEEYSADSTGRITPVGVLKGGETYSFKKTGSKPAWGIDSKNINVNGYKTTQNIDTFTALGYDIELKIKNQGVAEYKFDYLKDDIEEHSEFSYLTFWSNYTFPSSDPFEVYGVRADGGEQKLGEIIGWNGRVNASEANDFRSIKVISKTGKIPGFINGQSEYVIRFSIGIKPSRDYLESIVKQENYPYPINNTASVSIENSINESTGTTYVGKWGYKVGNNLALDKKPYYNNGAAYKVGDRLTTGHSHWWHIGRSAYGVEDLKNYKDGKVIYIFPQKMEFTDIARGKIKSGVWEYIENYKNTGKSAIIQNSDYSNVDFLKIGSLVESGTYELEKITIWSTESKNYGNGPDDLDFHNDGNTTSIQVARSKGEFVVENPILVGTLKQGRNLDSSGYFAESFSTKPGDNIEYRLSVINYNSSLLENIEGLEILPYAGDKSIVRDNSGNIGLRGSNLAVQLTGPVVDESGKFDILYSLDAPGANEDESMAKNFVSAAQISDFSKVRMIKFVQKSGTEIAAQSNVSLIVRAKVPENAANQSVAVNTFATRLGANSKLNEGNSVKLTVIKDAVVRGVAFEDLNKNGVYDAGTDSPIAGYKAKLVRESQVIAETTTGANGEYSFTTDKFANDYKVVFEKSASDTRKLVENQVGVNGTFEKNLASNIGDAENLGSFTFNLSETGEKEIVRNIGVYTPKGSVRVKFQTTDGVQLKADEMAAEDVIVGEQYSTFSKKVQEISNAEGLVFEFSKLKDGSAAETGEISEEEKLVIYTYAPKIGGMVDAFYKIENTDTDLAVPRTIIDNAQVGTKYSEAGIDELPDVNGLVYVKKGLRNGSAPQNGVVKTEAQSVIFDYIPKAGAGVFVKFIDENGTEIRAEQTLKADGSQVGENYSSTPLAEITFGGIKYVYKELAQDSSEQNGAVGTSKKVVKYVYTPKKGGQVLANFYDEEGNSIAETKVVSKTGTPVGTDYSDEPKAEITTDAGLKFTFKKLKEGSSAKSGKVAENSQEIAYVYAKKLGKGVVSKFVDEDGNEISPEVEVAADGKQVGEKYAAVRKDEISKDGLVYEFSKIADGSAPQNGAIKEESQTVKFVYRKKLGGKVVAKFVDKDGKELAPEKEIAAEKTQIGTPYESSKKPEIEKGGLVYVFENLAENSAPEKGKIKAETQEVVYIYAPKQGGSVIAKFVDKNGQEIQISKILKEKGTQVGTPYSSEKVEKISINGKNYILREVKGEESGKVSSEDIVIEYIFELEEIAAPNTGFEIAKNSGLAILALGGIALTALSKRFRKI